MGRETKTVIIKGVTVNEGDLVFIKFKKMEEVIEYARQNMRARDIMDHYDIDAHLSTFLQGTGHFKVSYVNGKDGYLKLARERDPNSRKRKQGNGASIDAFEEVVIMDHNNDNCDWTLNEVVIDEIRVENEAGESYFSETHQASFAVIGGKLFLNGKPITKADSKIFEMFEKVMADVAISNLLGTETEEDDDF